MTLDDIVSNLNTLSLFIPVIGLIVTFFYKTIKISYSDDVDLNKANRAFKKFLKTSLYFLFVFSSILLILFTLSSDLIQTYSQEWEMLENKNRTYITFLFFYSIVASALAFYSLIFFSNYKEETFLILEDSLGEHEYKLLSKAYEQNIVTIKYQNPENLDTVYEKAVDIKECTLIYRTVTKNIIQQDFHLIRTKSPSWLRLIIIVLIVILIAISSCYTFSVFWGYIELSSATDGFSESLFAIYIIISLTFVIPIGAGIIFLIKAYKFKWYK